jgi:hypothetical protein
MTAPTAPYCRANRREMILEESDSGLRGKREKKGRERAQAGEPASFRFLFQASVPRFVVRCCSVYAQLGWITAEPLPESPQLPRERLTSWAEVEKDELADLCSVPPLLLSTLSPCACATLTTSSKSLNSLSAGQTQGQTCKPPSSLSSTTTTNSTLRNHGSLPRRQAGVLCQAQGLYRDLP